MLKNKEKIKKILIIILIAIMSGIIFFYQTQKIGLHEDEGYTLCSSVNPNNGVMDAYDKGVQNPVWRTKEYVQNALTLTPNNILNFKALYLNQAYDNHPPFFYTLVHFATLFFGGHFSLYSAFIVNIIAFVSLKDNVNKTELEIIQDLQKKIPDYMCPKIKIIKNFPLNTNGKCDEKRLLEEF